jgi:DNA-binding transcriptional regulator GbsR (MarR family)
MSASQFPAADPAPSDWQRGFAEAMGGFVLVEGTPRAVMRVLGWMVVCQPREQTAADIREVLGLSAGSISAAVRTLGELGMLEHVTRPDDRRTFHRLREHGWEQALALHFRALGELRRLADSAIDTAAGDADERLLEMRDTYALLEDGIAGLLRESRWLGSGRAVASTTRLAADA